MEKLGDWILTSIPLNLMLMLLLLGGCAQNYSSPQQAAADACKVFGPRAQSGALIGLVGGAGVGAAVAAVASHGNGGAELIGAAAGAIVGTVAGLAEGHHLDQGDCAAAQLALQQMTSQPTGQPIAWSNPGTGSHGTFTPTGAAYDDPTGRICRKANADYTLAGSAPVTGDVVITCRSDDGMTWTRQPVPAAPAG